MLLPIAIFARYARHLAGAWRRTYVISATTALYLNVFVLVAQLFDKVPALKATAPTRSGPPLNVTQLILLALFVVLAISALLRFRNGQVRSA